MTDLELDVRPILRDGGEPFGAIMAAVGQLASGQRLKLLATFKPEPLFHVMASRGFTHAVSPLPDGDWMVLFTPSGEAPVAGVPPSPAASEAWPDPTHQLDCTDLDPPEPMVRILGQLEAMAQGEVLLALLGREPIFLFPELQARGHAWRGSFDDDNAVYCLRVLGGGRS